MTEHQNASCTECGAALARGRACEDYFHDLLALEALVPGAAGAEAHFYAVATYNLQHPSKFRPVALLGLHRTLVDVLAGQANVADARRRARYAFEGPTRVRFAPGMTLSDEEHTALAAWPTTWAMTVRDVSGLVPERYVDGVRAWAQAVAAALHVARAAVTARAD